ncbi:ankyrin repeat-containing domain protein [Aspergillus cavernicola]|uniref:Ankyrin repeat-containing domain protein n=1 Tax=Aspergillus cavernicola TaxID=176166 RepID=A0ABR4IVP1_9EURO
MRVALLYRFNIQHFGGCGILWAARHRSLSLVDRFIAEGFDVTATGVHDHPILHASEHGHVEVVEYLLDKGSDPQFESKNRKTPLHLAATNGYLPVIQALIDQPTFDSKNLSMRSKLWDEQEYPIQEAAYNKHQDVVEYLLSKLKPESTSTKTAANICLPDAAASGDISLVSFLLEHGADVNFQQVAETISRQRENFLGEPWHSPTALITAAKHGRTEMVKFLLTRGAYVNRKRGFPYTGSGVRISKYSFGIAMTRGDRSMVKLLLRKLGKAGTSGGERKLAQQNVLEIAARYDDVELFKLCLGYGFNEEEPLVEAIALSHEGIVNLLIERGTNPDVTSVRSRGAVGAAFSTRNVSIIKLLLRSGAHIHPETVKSYRWLGPAEMTSLAQQFPVLPCHRRSMCPKEEFQWPFD